MRCERAVAWCGLLSTGLSACVFGQAEVPEACYRLPELEVAPWIDEQVGIDGVGDALRARRRWVAGLDLPVVAVETSVEHEGFDAIPEHFAKLGFSPRAQLLRVDLRALEGVASFRGFVEVRVRVGAADPTVGLPAVLLGACGGNRDCHVADHTLRLRGERSADLLPYLELQRLETTLSLVGRPPVQTWVFDLEVCFRAEGTLFTGL